MYIRYRHVGHETGEREIHSSVQDEEHVKTRYKVLAIKKNFFCVCVGVCFVNVATEVVALLLYIMHHK